MSEECLGGISGKSQKTLQKRKQGNDNSRETITVAQESKSSYSYYMAHL